MKTLYVSDLDGTLLRSDETTSEYTNKIINELVDRGMFFSYATARSYNTSHKATKGLNAQIPLILYNGAFIMKNETKEIMLSNFFVKEEAEEIGAELLKRGVIPIVYAFINGEEKFSYIRKEMSKASRDFIDTRAGDARDNPIKSRDELLKGDVFYFTCIDDKEKLEPLYNKFKEKHHCVFYKDIYSNEQWLEIMPVTASKANAINQLKEYLGCNKLVAFGDGINDIDMFEIADECYAMENAVEELKKIATKVIGSNNEDGVAKWLKENYHENI